MIHRPVGVGAFEFVILASLRAAQLMRGCRPRIEGDHKRTVTAQLEVSQGVVFQDFTPIPKAIGEAVALALTTELEPVAVGAA